MVEKKVVTTVANLVVSLAKQMVERKVVVLVDGMDERTVVQKADTKAVSKDGLPVVRTAVSMAS